MAFDCFLKLDQIEGESQDKGHKGEIELLSINWGMTQAGTSGYGGGAGGGRVNMQDVVCMKRYDKASPKIMLHCCKGTHIKSGIVTIRKAGGEQQEYMKIKMTDILVSSIQAGGSSQGGDDIPTETLSLNFSKIEIEYKEQKPDGTLGGAVPGWWDVKQNVGG
jgi:type VI secretion system secreted protein Hcp